MKPKIVEKATEMFLKLGFKSVTMDDIAKVLGISKKTLYTHFKNKTELVKESTTHIFDNICDGIDEIILKKYNAIEELFEIKNFVLKNLYNEESSPSYQLQKYFPDIHSVLKNNHLEAVHECINNNIQNGIEQKLYRDDINREFITRIYFAGMSGIKDDEIFPSKDFKQKVLMGQFLDYHIRAIATSKGIETLNKFINQNN